MFIKTIKKQVNNENKKRISPSVVAFIGTSIILVGGFFLSYNYVMSKKVMVYDYMANVFNSSGSSVEQKEEEENIITDSNNDTSKKYDVNQYVGYLEIPKINFNKGFYPKESEQNNVDKNLLLVKEANYPDVAKGNLIIAGHSGTAWNSFFNNLYKLSVGDTAKVKFQGKTYTYKFVNIYKASKTGTISIYRNSKRTTLTLVTCTNNDSTTQTIYIGELESVE